jgi:small nuclear ribonucleoprotein (snRNP)-like protein
MQGPPQGSGKPWRRREGGGGPGGSRPPHGPHAQQGRKMPPSDSTGAEASYLLKNKEGRTPMVVRLLDGEEVRGVIEYYDRDMIKINRTDGPNVFIRKRHIRYMHEEPSRS